MPRHFPSQSVHNGHARRVSRIHLVGLLSLEDVGGFCDSSGSDLLLFWGVCVALTVYEEHGSKSRLLKESKLSLVPTHATRQSQNTRAKPLGVYHKLGTNIYMLGRVYLPPDRLWQFGMDAHSGGEGGKQYSPRPLAQVDSSCS